MQRQKPDFMLRESKFEVARIIHHQSVRHAFERDMIPMVKLPQHGICDAMMIAHMEQQKDKIYINVLRDNQLAYSLPATPEGESM